jgi:NAD(P)-dependent dehydrogenase (short-subunit alcohol dehydrogenase family)
MELENKNIIITGASSGIGAAAARLFSQEGANLILGARRQHELTLLANEINQENGGRVVLLSGDVSDPSFASSLVKLAQQEFGGLDGAFNNAGIVGEMSPISSMTIENWNSVVAVNLTAAFYAAQAQIPALQERGTGAIVFTSSFVGFSNGGLPGMSAYAATKAGLNGFVQSLAAEHAAEGIRINSLLPGGTITPAGGEGNSEVLAFVSGLHPIKRMAEPEEIAQAALFMLSDRSSFMTGTPMVVDGGMSVRLL